MNRAWRGRRAKPTSSRHETPMEIGPIDPSKEAAMERHIRQLEQELQAMKAAKAVKPAKAQSSGNQPVAPPKSKLLITDPV